MSTHDDSKPKTGESSETDGRRLDPSKSIDYDRVHDLLEHFYELGKVDRANGGVPPDYIADAIGASRETIRTILNESDRAERCWGIGPETMQQRYSYKPADADDEEPVADGGIFEGVIGAIQTDRDNTPMIPSDAVWDTLRNKKRRFIIAKLFQEPRPVLRQQLLKAVQKKVCPNSSYDSVSSTWVQTHRPLLLEYDLIEVGQDRHGRQEVTLTERGRNLGEILSTVEQRYEIVDADDTASRSAVDPQTGGDLSTDGGEQTVYVSAGQAPSGGKAVHTDPECPMVKSMDRVFEKPRSVLHNDQDECSWCSGDASPPGNTGPELASQIEGLLEDGEEIVTDGGEDQELVIIASNNHGSRSKFHTDPTCPYLKNIDNRQRVPRSHLFDDIDECQQCAGEMPGGVPDGKSLADKIREVHARGDDPEEELLTDGGSNHWGDRA